MQEYK